MDNLLQVLGRGDDRQLWGRFSSILVQKICRIDHISNADLLSLVNPDSRGFLARFLDKRRL